MPLRPLLALAVAASAVAMAAEDYGPPLPPVKPAAARVLTLTEALRLAHTQGRDKQTRDEELRLTALTLRNVRWDYAPQPTGSIGASLNGRGEHAPTDIETATLGATQSLPTGGSVGVTGTGAVSHPPDAGAVKTASAGATLHQPLLRGAGMLAWRENLTSAERAYLYAMRGFELYRQELTLSVSSTFWSLQGQQHGVGQAAQALARAEFIYEQSQALMTIGKANAIDVFRAETSLLQARQSQVDAQAAFAASLDQLKVQLALPLDQGMDVDDAPPTGPRVTVDASKAIAIALERRLDLMSVADQVRDAERGLILARRGLLPQLDLDAGVTYGGAAAPTWRGSIEGAPAWTVGVTLQLPFNLRDQELAYQRSLVGRMQASRALDEQRQQVIRGVLADITRLRAADASLTIQYRNRMQAAKRLEKAEIDVRAGVISNRDLVEAQEGVRDAENAWFTALVSYRGAELQLRLDTGTLEVREDGSWSEVLPPYAEEAK